MRVDPIKRDEQKHRRLELKLQEYKRRAAIALVCIVVYFFFIKLVFL
jgi:hypothetical protein